MNIPAPENHTDVAGGDASQPARKHNIKALADFFRSGIKPHPLLPHSLYQQSGR